MAFILDSGGIYRSELLARLDWLEHGFGTRESGAWLDGEPAATLSQIHSNIVYRTCGETGRLGEGDALVASTSGIWISIRTADCAPVVLADHRKRVIAVVHAGWRGAVDSILAHAVHRMCADFATSVSDLHAAIGPTIGHCCFEVGPEVARRFQPWFPERNDLDRKTEVDLPETLARQLRNLGVNPARIDPSGACTMCGGSRFESFRREGAAAGRMVTAARIRA